MTLDCLDQETRQSFVARRNLQFGIWVGRRLGHREDALALYARSVMDADYAVTGPDDVIERVYEDLWRSGIVIRRHDLVAELIRVEREVWAELRCTD